MNENPSTSTRSATPIIARNLTGSPPTTDTSPRSVHLAAAYGDGDIYELAATAIAIISLATKMGGVEVPSLSLADRKKSDRGLTPLTRL